MAPLNLPENIPFKFPDKDPSAKLDYSFKFANVKAAKTWLNEGDFIVEAVVDAFDAETLDAAPEVPCVGSVISVDQESGYDLPSQVTTIVGQCPEGVYLLTCSFKTNAGLQDQRSGILRVVQR